MRASPRRHLPLKAAVVALMFVGVTAAEAAQGVLTSRRVNELGPAADIFKGNLTLMWTQSRRARPERSKVLVRRNGRTIRVNAKGTKGNSGGIDDRIVVYQQINNGDSDIKRFDIRTRNRSNVRINTGKWEWRPSISGRWILFGRNSRRGDKILLFNTATGNTRRIGGARGDNFAAPDQVNGDFAVFTICKEDRGCDVFRYRISTGNKQRIPNKRRVQYAASVTRKGTVYFAGSGFGCGSRVALYRRRNGNTQRIQKIGRKDTFDTFAAPRIGGGVNIYYETGRCGKRTFARRNNFNIYKVRG